MRIAILLLAAYLLLVVALYAAQRSFLYFPDKTRVDAAAAGFADVDGTHFSRPRTGSGSSSGTALRNPESPPSIFFHGNAGSIADRPNRWAFLKERGYGALFVSYRGYGGSTGSPTEGGLTLDALAAYDWLAGQGMAGRSDRRRR